MMNAAATRVLCELAGAPKDPSQHEQRREGDGQSLNRTHSLLASRALITHLEDGRWTIHPSLGYDKTSLQRVIPSRYRLTFRDTTGSTNRLAGELPVPAPPCRRLVIARQQEAGRGRFDRTWDSPSGGIWASILDGEPRQPKTAWLDQLAMSVAITDLTRCLGVPTGVKWPNDVVTATGDKLAGVLVESTVTGGRLERLICGVGLNVDIQPDVLPEEATSLAEHCNAVNPIAIVPHLLTRYEHRRSNPTETLDTWRTRSSTLGRPVSIELASGTRSGIAEALTDAGELVLSTRSGRLTISPEESRRLRYRD